MKTFRPALQQFNLKDQAAIRYEIEVSCDVSPGTVFNWLNGSTEPKLSQAGKIANIIENWGYTGKIWFDICPNCDGDGRVEEKENNWTSIVRKCEQCEGRGYLE